MLFSFSNSSSSLLINCGARGDAVDWAGGSPAAWEPTPPVPQRFEELAEGDACLSGARERELRHGLGRGGPLVPPGAAAAETASGKALGQCATCSSQFVPTVTYPHTHVHNFHVYVSCLCDGAFSC